MACAAKTAYQSCVAVKGYAGNDVYCFHYFLPEISFETLPALFKSIGTAKTQVASFWYTELT